MHVYPRERFSHDRRMNGKAPTGTAQVSLLPQQLNVGIRDYFAKTSSNSEPWLRRSEVPSSGEVMDVDGASASSSDIMEIAPNRPQGAWESKEAYLSAHYELLREDAVRPIREAVQQVRSRPAGDEGAFDGTVGIYDKVHICAITYSTRGIAIRTTFSLARAKKRIMWEQSKRLVSGTLVVLTPKHDMFKTTAIVATVAARSQTGVQLDPPEIDLFIARAEELEIDPAKEWVMVENRSSYFEANRHTLLALQKMMGEPFPLQEHLVSAMKVVPPPPYLLQHPIMDLSAALHASKRETYENVDVLADWPAHPLSDMDPSQLAALQRGLTGQLAVIQGPPGTGKTYVSVQAIKLLLANRKDGDPPTIIACQTNHAVDQILRLIAEFETDFIRLGGRSKDKGIIKQRTLYEVRQQNSEDPPSGCLDRNAGNRMRALEKEIQLLLAPLQVDKNPLDLDVLVQYGLLNDAQVRSLENGASDWVQSTLSNPNQACNPFTLWLGSALITVPAKQLPDKATSEFAYEEAELEIEQLKDVETEAVAKDDDDFDNLRGNTRLIVDNFTCRKPVGVTIATGKIQDALRQKDLWRVPEALRAAAYRYLQSELKKRILDVVRPKVKAYDIQANQRRIGGWERDEPLLKKQKIIGMTTTGLSKYRALLAALKPKIILIEEAAETLEAPVTVACVPSLQQLILVGDHKQLRPHCQVKTHEGKPFFLDISLFERMVNNEVEYSTLIKQRRMIPEIRRLLYPIYRDLIQDHASVLNKESRPDVPGMGGINSLWFTHQYTETRDSQMSMVNPEEAEMIVGMVEYLCYNNMDPDDITILTFYNGQRRELLRSLRKKSSLLGRRFNVVTVDSYQGEENKVVLLSLVRSNDFGQIGFLGIDNRICVALSRARCGFYIFGNGELLHNAKTWKTVIRIMADQGPSKAQPKLQVSRLFQTLPVTCSNHNNTFSVHEASDWDKITGGCDRPCGERLACGHKCLVTCHPFSHDFITCQQLCARPQSCGHQCSHLCGEPCACSLCTKDRGEVHAYDEAPLQPQLSSSSWQAFADIESKCYAIAASAPASRRSSPVKPAQVQPLVELGLPDVGSLTLMESEKTQCSSSSFVIVSEEQSNDSGAKSECSLLD